MCAECDFILQAAAACTPSPPLALPSALSQGTQRSHRASGPSSRPGAPRPSGCHPMLSPPGPPFLSPGAEHAGMFWLARSPRSKRSWWRRALPVERLCAQDEGNKVSSICHAPPASCAPSLLQNHHPPPHRSLTTTPFNGLAGPAARRRARQLRLPAAADFLRRAAAVAWPQRRRASAAG